MSATNANSPSTASPSAKDGSTSTDASNKTAPASTVDKQQLLKQLAKQLIYYFSTQNLSKDVYLQTIMNLNSGHVPISILANFANVNKIIGRSGILLNEERHPYTDNSDNENDVDANADADNIANTTANDDSTNDDKGEEQLTVATGASSAVDEEAKETETDTDDNGEKPTSEWKDYTLQIHDLLRQAAQESNLLSVVILNQNGAVVDENDTVTEAAEEDSASFANNEEGESSSTSNTSTGSAVKRDSRIRTFDAIGPSPSFNGTISDDDTLNIKIETSIPEEYEAKNIVAAASYESANASISNSNGSNEKTSIVILRDVHVDATEEDIRQVFEKDQILSVQKEIGNCWFVTLDTESNPQDVLTTMLDLRNKKICNESIKARLKTSSSSIQPSSTSPAVTSTNTYRQNYYPGRNPYYRSGARNKTPAMGGAPSSRGYYNQYQNANANPSQVYSGDRVSFSGAKKITRGGFGEKNGGAYGKQQYHTPKDGKANNQSGPVDNTKLKKVEKSLPPPPVVEEHYPSLDGVAGESSPSSVTNLYSGGGGYAAALLKDAPPAPPATTLKLPPAKAVTNIPSYTSKSGKKKKESRANFTSGKGTVGTISTDDSSSDDKSSLSSKPESENFSGGAPASAPAPRTVWGGGRSFADIVKK